MSSDNTHRYISEPWRIAFDDMTAKTDEMERLALSLGAFPSEFRVMIVYKVGGPCRAMLA